MSEAKLVSSPFSIFPNVLLENKPSTEMPSSILPIVSIGGITVTNQTFAVANNVSADQAQHKYDGLIGCAFSSLAEDNGTTVFENVSLVALIKQRRKSY